MSDSTGSDGVKCLHDGGVFQVHADRIVLRDGSRAVVHAGGSVVVNDRGIFREWALPAVPPGYASYEGDFPSLNAVYSLAMGELMKNRSRGAVFSTGDNWNSLWTRDVAYAAHLGLAMVDAEGCKSSLEARVARGEVMQDTGTGGAWPVSTDRVSWGVAAWEVYLMTGDCEWLRFACDVLERTCRHDDRVIRDVAGLVRGESSFLDWRSQSYPDWMTPSDIAESCALSTMVLHAHASRILCRMKLRLGKRDEALFWRRRAAELWGLVRDLFWVPSSGLFGQFLYGRGYPVLSERPDSLGNLLCLLWGEKWIGQDIDLRRVVDRLPHCSVGIPCFHPQKSMDVPFYHNGACWPFVEGYYGIAASFAGNGAALAKSLACLVRSALMLGTNKENINLETGRDDGLVLSSNAQLWSISGMLGIFYKGLLGIRATHSALVFRPCIPEGWGGEHRLRGGVYRKAGFDLIVRGEGRRVKSCMVNGVSSKAELQADAEGHFIVEIELEPWRGQEMGLVNLVPVVYDLRSPRWKESEGELAWEAVPNASYYRIFRNGIPVGQTERNFFVDSGVSELAHYQVMACSFDGRESFLNEPREWNGRGDVIETRPCGMKGDQAWLSGSVESSSARFYDIYTPVSGVYRVEAYYSNGTGDLKDGNTCALRSLLIDGERVCSLSFPHGAGQDEWDAFSYSPGYDVVLNEGVHHVELALMEEDENTNYFVNQCLIRNLRFVRMVQV